MKRFFLKGLLLSYLLIIATASCSFSQHIRFAYDEYGNRISRYTVILEEKSELPDSLLDVYNGVQLSRNTDSIQISLFPNPTSDFINIQCNGLENNTSLGMYLFSVTGQSLKTFTLNVNLKTIDLSDIPCGMYYLKIKTNNKTLSWKIVKQ